MSVRNYPENGTCSYVRETWQQDLIGNNLCLLQIHLFHLVSQLAEGSAHSEAPHTFLLLIHCNLRRNRPQIHLGEENRLKITHSSKNVSKLSLEINWISFHRDDWVSKSLLKATLSYLFFWKHLMLSFVSVYFQFLVNSIILNNYQQHTRLSELLLCQSLTTIFVFNPNQNRTIEVVKESLSNMIFKCHFKVDFCMYFTHNRYI